MAYLASFPKLQQTCSVTLVISGVSLFSFASLSQSPSLSLITLIVYHFHRDEELDRRNVLLTTIAAAAETAAAAAEAATTTTTVTTKQQKSKMQCSRKSGSQLFAK